MPALARDHQRLGVLRRGCRLIGRFTDGQARLDLFQNGLLRLLPSGVEGIEGVGALRGRLWMTGDEHLGGDPGVGHAAGGVDAGGQTEGDVLGRDPVGCDAGGRGGGRRW